MRHVQVFKNEWVPGDKHNGGHYKKVPDYTAVFHQWGVGYEEFESGPGNYTCAIVEKPDGSIEMPIADVVQFISTPKAKPAPYVEPGVEK